MDLESLTTTNRFKLLKILGGKCRICSVNEIKYLEIDHIYNDGADERTKYGSSEKIYGWYLQHQNKAFRRLQPLCKEHHEEKHNPVLLSMETPRKITSKVHTFMKTLVILEGNTKKPVRQDILVQELCKTNEFTEEESKKYIQRYMKECFIYESSPLHYNSVEICLI